jgi:hypothetical protein
MLGGDLICLTITFLGSPYLFSMRGRGGIKAQCNLDMLDSMAFTLNGLVGPWILGGIGTALRKS